MPAPSLLTLSLAAQLHLLNRRIAYMQARILALEDEVRVLRTDLQRVEAARERDSERDLRAEEIEAERLKWVQRGRMTSEEREEGRKRVRRFLEYNFSSV
jgi:hypothetical protein